MNLEGQLTRSSLGRIARMGELYSIKDETLSSQSLFKSSFPQQAFGSVDIANTKFNFNFTENISDKFDLLKVEAELQLSVLLELIKAKGSGEFLTEEKKSEKIISCALNCQIRTVQDKFFASFEEILPHVDLTALRNREYTHFVSETTWGANCLLTLEVSCEDEQKKKSIKSALKLGLSKFKILADVQLGGEVDKSWSKFFSSGDLNIKIHADFVPEDEWPTTVEGFFEFLSKVPKLLKNVNGGKGKPLSYTLLPLEELRKFAELDNSFDLIVRKIDEAFVTSIVFLFEEIAGMKQKLHDLHTEFMENLNYVKSQDLKEATMMKEKLSTQESKLKTFISENWVLVRSGEKELKDLVRQIEKLKTCDLKLYQYEEYVNSCSPILKKLSNVKRFSSQNVMYLGKKETFNDLQLCHPVEEFIVLVTCSEFEENDAELCRNTSLYFLSLVEKNFRLVVVDLDLTDKGTFLNEYVSEPRCYHLCGNKMLCKDLYAKHLEEIKSNFARPGNDSKWEFCKHKPGNRVHLAIPCPKFESGTCTSESQIWLCYACKYNIEFGFDGNFYCACGKCPANAFEFRCNDPKHGNCFVIAEEEFLKKVLSLLRPLKEMNIVILGQSGVGKSTWINSIANYLTYDTMDAVREHGVIYPIPVRFAFHDPFTHKEQEIKLGEKVEEVDVGMSDTQSAHSYSFLWEGRCVRIIDTPGVGDTRGIDKDKENMKSIMEHLGYLKEIHGLCILLKANDNRFTKLFSYCIKELMVHLPKSVVQNIVFCFTNSRGALYTAGQGSAILSKLISELGLEEELSLSEQNMFTLDNEAFMFLCSLSCSDFSYPPKVINSYAESWKMAADETYRLLNVVKTFEPRLLLEMISLVNIRERILTLTKPLAEVGKTIQLNVAQLETREKELQESSLSIQELQDKLFVNETFLKMKALPHPQTVCASKNCVRVVEFNNIKQIEYHTICHEKCYLPQVEPKTVNNSDLRNCDVMYAGTCTNCLCGWEEHMHLTYSQERENKIVKNTSVEEKIEKQEQDIKIKEEFIEGLKKKTEDYKKEQDTIIQASVKFGMFLKKNAITVYNDSVEDYLKHLIQEQEKIEEKTETDEKIFEAMKNTLERYKHEVKVLKQVMKQAEDTELLSFEEISKLESSLYDLPLTGEQIKQCVEVSRKYTALQQDYRETPIQVGRKHRRTTEESGVFMGSVKSAIKGVRKLFSSTARES